MKNFKIFFLSALVAVAGLFTACVEDTEIAPGPAVSEDCMEVYFVPAEAAEYSFAIDADMSQVVVPVTVARTYFTDAITLPLTVQQNAQVFNVPESVEFAAGQETATFNITINTPELGNQTLNISLGEDPAIVNPYLAAGAPIYGLTFEFFKWEKVCDALFKSALFSTPRPTTLENKAGSSLYRLTSLWADGVDFNFTLGADGKAYSVPQSDWVGTMSGYPVIFTGLGMGGLPLLGAFDADPKYSYFSKGQGMVMSIYYLTNAQQFGWFNEVVLFQ